MSSCKLNALSMNSLTHTHFDYQTAISLAWAGMLCIRGTTLRSFDPENPSQEARS